MFLCGALVLEAVSWQISLAVPSLLAEIRLALDCGYLEKRGTGSNLYFNAIVSMTHKDNVILYYNILYPPLQ